MYLTAKKTRPSDDQQLEAPATSASAEATGPQTKSPDEIRRGLDQVLGELQQLGAAFRERKQEAIDWQNSFQELCRSERVELSTERAALFLRALDSVTEGGEPFAKQFAGFDLKQMIDILKKWETVLMKDARAKATIQSLHAFYRIIETVVSNTIDQIAAGCGTDKTFLIDPLAKNKAAGHIFFKEDQKVHAALMKGVMATDDKNEDGLASYRQEAAQGIKHQCDYLDVNGSARFNGFMTGCESYDYAEIVERVPRRWDSGEDDYRLNYTGKWGFKRTFAGYSTCIDQRPIKQIVQESLANGFLKIQNGELTGDCLMEMREMYQYRRTEKNRIPIHAAVEILLGKRNGNVRISIKPEGKSKEEALAAFKNMYGTIPDDLISCW